MEETTTTQVHPLLNDVREAADEHLGAAMHLNRSVRLARRAGISWTDIGKALEITKQAAQQRFGPTIGEMEQPLFQEPQL